MVASQPYIRHLYCTTLIELFKPIFLKTKVSGIGFDVIILLINSFDLPCLSIINPWDILTAENSSYMTGMDEFSFC